MQFTSHGQPFTDDGFRAACGTLAVEPAALWSVLTVETRGFGFLADRRPRLLFERHYFHRLTQGRFDASHPGISAPDAGGYIGGAGEYRRLEEAIALDESAALQSASWGIGQVMGANFVLAGFKSVTAMVTAIVEGENAQLLAAARFIVASQLAAPLQRQDWTTFARGYNGPKFEENDYPRKLKDAFATWTKSLPDIELRTAQAALLYLGFKPGDVDGRMGPATRDALLRFQRDKQLPATGALNADTSAALMMSAFPAV